MKFKVNSYHFKLLRDYERLSAFKEAIDDYAIRNGMDSNGSNSKVAFDLGCGSGVLSYFASEYMDRIIAIELNNSTYQLAKENLKEFDNIQVFNDDILSFDFSKLNEKADLIICEMLDTALIDEEEVPVLNRARKFLKDDGEIIPKGMINSAEPIFMNNHFIQYEDDEYSPIYVSLGVSVVYSEFDFLDDIGCDFSAEMELKIFNRDDLDKIGFEENLSEEKYDKFNLKENFNIEEDKLKINGIKLTSFTKLNENIICGPTPMLNPEMLIPIEEAEVRCGDSVRIRLEYVMGGGVETIKTEILEIVHDD
ncbi:methyltransferase domain-containing protein [uncultured Methanobrevibacter sp.]|uniref:methyltransferase domain-containing protein n=1 Tax=uncultured Methanobrevibacter sp. TaxID=253161 RepID=UPI002622AF5F|nr:methyltransferase domain-containing protein [uncultured Methanobrevibacter sp.]